MNEKEREEYEAYKAYQKMFPDEGILSPDMLKEEYSSDEHITDVYKQCVKEHKTIDEVVLKEHFLEDMPDSDY